MTITNKPTINTNIIHTWGIISLGSVVLIELLLDYFIVVKKCSDFCLSLNCNWRIDLFIVALSLLVFSIIANRQYIFNNWKNKIKNILKDLIKNSISGNLLDLLFVVFFLLHLTWIPDSIFEVIKGEYNICHLFIFIFGFVGGIFIKPAVKKINTKEPLVLLSGISDIDYGKISTLAKPIKEYELIEKVVIFIDPNIKFGDLKMFWENGIINKVTCTELLSLKNEREGPNWNGLDYRKLNIISRFLKILIGINDIDLKVCSYEFIQPSYEMISKTTDKLLENKYKNEHLLFNLTPGNKNISIALALNSIREKRRSCYIQQSGKNEGEIVREELDVFRLKDIFSEIMN